MKFRVIDPLSFAPARTKKTWVAFLCFAFILFGLNLEVAAQFNCDSLQCKKGDLNGDSILTPADIVLQLNCIFMGATTCDTCPSDVNCDGRFSPADVAIELNAAFLVYPIDNIRYPMIADADTSSISDSSRRVYRNDAEQ